MTDLLQCFDAVGWAAESIQTVPYWLNNLIFDGPGRSRVIPLNVAG